MAVTTTHPLGKGHTFFFFINSQQNLAENKSGVPFFFWPFFIIRVLFVARATQSHGGPSD